MPSYEWSQEHNAFVKHCVTCNEVFIGAYTQQESEIIFRKDFGVGGRSNLDGLYTSCNLCNSGRTYGYKITHAEKRALYKRQGRMCPICLGELDYNKVSLDHCHTTGIVRGLLHIPCNSQLGFYEKHGDRIKRYIGETNEDN